MEKKTGIADFYLKNKMFSKIYKQYLQCEENSLFNIVDVTIKHENEYTFNINQHFYYISTNTMLDRKKKKTKSIK